MMLHSACKVLPHPKWHHALLGSALELQRAAGAQQA